MNNSAEDYIYVLEDAKGNSQEVAGRLEALKLLEEGIGFKLRIYRLWRVCEEKRP